MKTRSALLAALVLFGIGASRRARADDDDVTVFKPAPGRDAVRPMRPDWCAAYRGEDKSNCDKNCQQRTLDSFVHNFGGEPREADLPRIAALACDFPNNPAVQQQVAYFRQSWINRTGVSERDDRAALRLYVGATGNDGLDHAVQADCARIQPTAEQGSVARAQQILIANALCNGNPISTDDSTKPSFDDLLALRRPGMPISMIASAWYVFHAVETYDPDGDFFSASRDRVEAIFPIANVVLAQLDPAALETEIHALGLSGVVAYRARVLFGAARVRAQPWGDFIRKSGDAQLAKSIAAAEAAFTAWSTLYQSHKAELDLANAVEDKVAAVPFLERSKPHAIGCEPLRAAVSSHAAATKPRTSDAVRSALTDTVGYPMLARLVACDAAEGRWADAAAEREVLQTGRFALGPFAAAAWGTIDAGGQLGTYLRFQDGAAVMADSILSDHVQSVSTLNEVYDGTGGVSEAEFKAQGHMIEQGRVAKVTKGATGITAAFKAITWSEPSFQCTNTGRISQFESDGTPVYFHDCKMTGSHTESFQLDPRVFTDRSGGGLRAGQIVKVVTSELQTQDQSPTAPNSFVLEVDAPGRGNKPPKAVSYFGVALK